MALHPDDEEAVFSMCELVGAVRPDAAATVKIWIGERTDDTAAFKRWINRQAQFAQHRQIRTKAGRDNDLVDDQRATFSIVVTVNGQGAAPLRKTIIVALARKLLIALWRYTTADVVIEGAVMKAESATI